MKNDLLCLIEQIDYIKSFFHIVGGTGIPQLNVIYDKAEDFRPTPVFTFCVFITGVGVGVGVLVGTGIAVGVGGHP